MNGASLRETFPDGLTIAELKKLLAHWPDEAPDGQPWRVWLKNGDFVTSLVYRAEILGKNHLLLAGAFPED